MSRCLRHLCHGGGSACAPSSFVRATLLAIPFLGLSLAASPAGAQDLDDLDDLDEGVVLEEVFEPGIEENSWEISVMFGTMDVSQELLRAPAIIVDIEEPGDFILADMNIQGEQSFAPGISLARTFGRNLALEATAMFAVGDFEQSLTGDPVKYTDPLSENELTEEEREKGSFFQWNTSLQGIWYPRGEGRIQPYVIGGLGYQLMEFDSVYVDGNSTTPVYSYGVGLRIVGDDLYSFRIEVRNYHSNHSFVTANDFATIVAPNGGGLFDIPVFQQVGGTSNRILVQLDDNGNILDPELAELFESLGIRPSNFITEENEGASEVALPAFSRNVEYDDSSFSQLHVTVGFVAAF